MGNVYTVDAEKSLILYSARNFICLRTAVGENLTRPIILRSDYASGLSDTVYDNTIYYAYQNTERDIIIRSIIERDDLYKISSHSTPDCFYPQIAVIKEKLILFYFVKNPIDNNYCLKSFLPFQQEQKLILPETLFSSLPMLHILSTGTMILVYLLHDTEEYIFSINEELQCDKLAPECSIPVEELDKYKEENQKKQEMLSQAQSELNKNKELLSQIQKQVSKFQTDILNRDQLIQSIRRQYEELMDTAMKYREEAVKWHNKFYGK